MQAVWPPVVDDVSWDVHQVGRRAEVEALGTKPHQHCRPKRTCQPRFTSLKTIFVLKSCGQVEELSSPLGLLAYRT
jgi:hypothetical protein